MTNPETRTLRLLIHRLIAHGCLMVDADDYLRCFFCGAYTECIKGEDVEKHKARCPYVAAQLLEM